MRSVQPINGAGPILVIGSAGMDIVGRCAHPLQLGTSNPSVLRTSQGGVARNVAENLAHLGAEVILITAVGADPQGERLLAQTASAGVDVSPSLVVPERSTGVYLALLDEAGRLHIGMDDMRVIEAITPDTLRERRELFRGAQALFLDANLLPKTLSTAVSLAARARVPIAADPTSLSLAPSIAPHLDRLWLITPNEAEAAAICPHEIPHADAQRAIEAARHLVGEGVEIVIITMAEFGLGYASIEGSGHVPAVQTEIVDPTGAGDALTAAVMFALLQGVPLDEAVRLGLSAAALTLRTPGSVVPNLSLELLYDQLR